ncbi:hypothetical protein M758_2G033500 [Ceratodon purpureus]|uniref:1-phosphatidylinositol-3-phosphate 5-kinase n=1 Tax=Ceratodon purpureus TaxID=3225 RepID=A0A8T0IRT6_CERPU|nr:hypothetical protein KC19_2G034400 [Ceratodon purpureus]KAG0625175.1 hypothetical protein M758_2G033500 [Ceratodon purpureus]
MSGEEEEFVKKEDRGGQDPEYEIDGGKRVQMADPEQLGVESQEQSFSSLSRSSTQSFENIEKANEEISSRVEKIFKLQTLSSRLDSFKDVEGIWFNKDVWVTPPAEADDEVMGSSLVDDDDDEDDDEGSWGQHSSPESSRSGSDHLQSKVKMRAKLERDFLLVVENLLQEEGIPKGEEGDPNSWLQIVSTLAMQAATYVKPNTSKGGVMDPGEYVKVKCIASGKCADSTVVKGVVCHKNVQHKRMKPLFKNPRILLLGGALEYQRSQNQLSSLTGVLQQEIDYLTATVKQIDAIHPNVLLVEKTVAGFAQDKLLDKEVSVVLNVKRPLLERIARCTGAQVVSSLDNLTAAKVGQCELFRIERFEEDLNAGVPGTKKTSKYLTTFEGCPRPLGCTILLRGAGTEELKRVKKAVKLTVFHAYHLSLETSFLADEGATLPSTLQCIPSSKRSSLDSSISTVPGFTPRATSHGRNDSWNNLAGQRNNSQAEDLGGISQRGSSDNLDTQQFVDFTEEFPQSSPDHQSIVVSTSSRTMSKGNVCEKPQLKRIKYYGPSDKPMGMFLREFLGNTANRCPKCDEPMEDHEQRYTHARGCLTLYSKVLRGAPLPSEKEGKIWMWHRCLRCARPDGIPPTTRRVPLSDSAQNISFGKFLQLSFSKQAVETTTGCGHCAYRDSLRFFGIGNTVACFLYNPIKLLAVTVPPPQMEFNIPNLQGWLKVEAQEIVELGLNLFAAAREQLRGLGDRIAGLEPLYSSKAPEARAQLVGLENLLEKERDDFEEQLQMAAPLQEGVSEPIADILALNKLRRHLALVYNGWDNRVKKLLSYLWQIQNFGRSAGLEVNGPPLPTSSPTIANSVSEAGGGAASASEERSSEGPAVDSVPQDLESGSALPESTESASGQLSVEDATGALEETDGELIVENSDSPEDAEDAGKVENLVVNRESGEGLDGLYNKTPILGRQTSSPLPRTTSSDLPATIETGHPRSRSEGHYPIMVDLPDTLEAAWRGETGSIDASIVPSPKPEVVEGPVGASGGEDVEVSDLSAMTAPTSQEEVAEGDEVQVEVPAGVDLDVSRPASPLQDKEVVDFEASRATPPLNDAEEADLVLSRPVSPLKDKEDLDSEVSRPASPMTDTEEAGLVMSRPTSPFKDKEGSEEAGVATGMSLSSGLNRGYRSSSLLQSNASVYNAPYNRSNSTVPKVQQFFLQGVARVRLPPGVNGTVVAVYEDEPTSIIAYAITSLEYQSQLQNPVLETPKDTSEDREVNTGVEDAIDMMDDLMRSSTPPLERPATPKGTRGESWSTEKTLISPTPLTVKVRFADYGDGAKTEFQVVCYYAKQFIALRAKCCGGEMEYIRSLSRCKTWGAQGGKSKAYFAKTLDDRFIVKQVSSTEKYSFLEFAPQYFRHLWDSMSTGSPTCLAKIVGFYTVTVRKGGKEKEMDVLVMENLVYGKAISRMYDLKGSLRSRYNPQATGTLLDQNLLEDMPTSPIFMTNKSKVLLERAVYNDTSFLAKVNVMDYSLLAVVLEDRQELVIGIIDYIRQYTWDKHLETWVKASGILGGSKHTTPTVVSPKEYKKRFRKAISSYFVVVPESKAPPLLCIGKSQPRDSSPLPSDDSQQSARDDA